MKNFIMSIVMILLSFTSCQKTDNISIIPTSKPTEIEPWMIDAGYYETDLNAVLYQYEQNIVLKSSSNNSSDDNGIQIQWADSLNNGISPIGPIHLDNYEEMQLTYIFLKDVGTNIYQINWYTNDQQIVQAYYDGRIKADWIGNWWGPTYPNVTIISLFCYRQNPKWKEGDKSNKKWLEPFQDSIIVYVDVE